MNSETGNEVMQVDESMSEELNSQSRIERIAETIQKLKSSVENLEQTIDGFRNEETGEIENRGDPEYLAARTRLSELVSDLESRQRT